MTYYLKAEDLTHLGGPMGTEYTTTIFRKYFTTEQKAKSAAEEHYESPITWRKDGDRITSGDLSWVMYTIGQVKVEG